METWSLVQSSTLQVIMLPITPKLQLQLHKGLFMPCVAFHAVRASPSLVSAMSSVHYCCPRIRTLDTTKHLDYKNSLDIHSCSNFVLFAACERKLIEFCCCHHPRIPLEGKKHPLCWHILMKTFMRAIWNSCWSLQGTLGTSFLDPAPPLLW